MASCTQEADAASLRAVIVSRNRLHGADSATCDAWRRYFPYIKLNHADLVQLLIES